MDKHQEQLSGLKKVIRFNRLCALNVIEQVLHVSETDIVRDAWARQQRLSIHGWIYAIDNGLLQDLSMTMSRPDEAARQYEAAVKSLAV
jgi:carbonic anhydrase